MLLHLQAGALLVAPGAGGGDAALGGHGGDDGYGHGGDGDSLLAIV